MGGKNPLQKNNFFKPWLAFFLKKVLRALFFAQKIFFWPKKRFKGECPHFWGLIKKMAGYFSPPQKLWNCRGPKLFLNWVFFWGKIFFFFKKIFPGGNF